LSAKNKKRVKSNFNKTRPSYHEFDKSNIYIEANLSNGGYSKKAKSIQQSLPDKIKNLNTIKGFQLDVPSI